MTARLWAALARSRVPFLRDEPLARHTTLGVGGPVPALLRPADGAELSRALAVLAELDFPWRTIGAGSNLLVADEGLEFAVIATEGICREPVFDATRVTADCGVFLPRLSRLAAERGLAGLEWGIGIPGSVGGALRMNAGAWGSDMSLVVDEVFAISRASGCVEAGPFAPRFSYRGAGVGPATVVTGVVFRLRSAPAAEVSATLERLLAERKRSQPVAARSAGCAFKNPADDSAGRLVDAAGLKGLARGAAVVSPLHGNFILNRGGARAADVAGLIEEVRARVLDHTGIRLEDEIVRWSGDPSNVATTGA